MNQWELMREICRADFDECWAWTGKTFEQHWPIPENQGKYIHPQPWIGRGLSIAKHLMKTYKIEEKDGTVSETFQQQKGAERPQEA